MIDKKSDLERRFHKNAKQSLAVTFIPDNIQTTKDIEHGQLASAVKKESWDRVLKSGGNINIKDLVSIDDEIALKLSDAGLWDAGDIFRAYNVGHVKELASLGLNDDGSISKKMFDTIAESIVSYPASVRAIDKKDIVKELNDNFDKGSKQFKARRGDEIRSFLEKLGLDGNLPFMAVLKDEGDELTHDEAERMLDDELTGFDFPGPMLTSLNEVIQGYGNFKKLLLGKVLAQSIKVAMKRGGMDNDQIKKLSKQKALAGNGKGKKGVFDHFSTQEKKFEGEQYRIDFLKKQIDELVASGTLVNDPFSGIRASDIEMARYILKTKGKMARIGKTNNFMIPSYATYLTTDNVGNAKPGQLVFQVNDIDSNYPVRMTGQMLVNDESDIDRLIDVLGTNPKNGFAPVGYEHGNKRSSEMMNTFTVFATIPVGKSIIEAPVINISKENEKYIIKVENVGFIGTIPIHLWKKKTDVTEKDVQETINEILDKVSVEMYGRNFADLTDKEKRTISATEEDAARIWGIKYRYAGSLCPMDPKKSSAQSRLRALRDDMKTSTELVGDVSDAGDEVKQMKEDIISKIDVALSDHESRKKSEIGTLNVRSIPNCLYIPVVDDGNIIIEHGSDSGYVENHLDSIISICDKNDDKQSCYLDNLSVMQNALSAGNGRTGIESKIYAAVNGSKTDKYKKEEEQFKQDLRIIERKIRTGVWTEKRANELKRIKGMHLDDTMDRAKLLGKMELDIGTWKFMDNL